MTVENYLPKDLIKSREISEEEAGKGNIADVQEQFLQYGISIESGMSHSLNDEDTYFELVKLFLKEYQKKEDMCEFLEAHNMKDYAILVHGLKGNARTLGADALADMAYNHEMKSKAGDIEYVVSHWEELLDTWANTLVGLKKLLNDYGAEGEKARRAVSVNGNEILQLGQSDLEKVAALLDDFESKAAIRQLKTWLDSPLEPDMYECIKNALTALEDEFDEDKAIEILREKGAE